MRLFAAVVPPDDVLDDLASAVGAVPHEPVLRWSSRDQWHLTVAFFGEVSPPTVDDLAARLARAASRTPSLSLRLSGAGAFPRPVRSRVVWIGVTGDVQLLGRLAERAGAAGRRAGIAMEDRKFRAHLTVARSRREPVDATATVAALASYAGRGWRAREVCLVRSVLGASPRYDVVGRWPFGGDRAGPVGD